MKLLVHSQTKTGALLKFENGYVISSQTLYVCNYISILGLKLIHVTKMGPWYQTKSEHEEQV